MRLITTTLLLFIATMMMMMVMISTLSSSGVHAASSIKKATCVLKPTNATTLDISGTLFIEEDEVLGNVTIYGEIRGFPAGGVHGMHIHAKGDISDAKGMGTGSHFNPYGHTHDNDLSNEHRHVGDMGNVTVDSDGVIRVSITDGLLFTLSGNMSVIGRAIIVHEKRDIGAASADTGDAGLRYAQCVIGISNPGDSTVSNHATADDSGAGFPYGTCALVGESAETKDIVGLVSVQPATTGNGVTVSAKVCGLSDGAHGFHIHTFGDMTGAIGNVGSHYNPQAYEHGLPKEFDDAKKIGHVGDLGDLQSKNGVAKMSAQLFTKPQLSGVQSVIGRAFVVHAGKDNGKVEQPSGASGTMLVRCVIGVTSDKVDVLTKLTCPTEANSASSSSYALITMLLVQLVAVLVFAL